MAEFFDLIRFRERVIQQIRVNDILNEANNVTFIWIRYSYLHQTLEALLDKASEPLNLGFCLPILRQIFIRNRCYSESKFNSSGCDFSLNTKEKGPCEFNFLKIHTTLSWNVLAAADIPSFNMEALIFAWIVAFDETSPREPLATSVIGYG